MTPESEGPSFFLLCFPLSTLTSGSHFSNPWTLFLVYLGICRCQVAEIYSAFYYQVYLYLYIYLFTSQETAGNSSVLNCCCPLPSPPSVQDKSRPDPSTFSAIASQTVKRQNHQIRLHDPTTNGPSPRRAVQCSAGGYGIYLRYTPPPQKYHSTSPLTRPPYHFHTASRYGSRSRIYPLIYRGFWFWIWSAGRLLTRWTARQQRPTRSTGPGGPPEPKSHRASQPASQSGGCDSQNCPNSAN